MSESLKKRAGESPRARQGEYMNQISPPKRRYSALKKQMDDSLSKYYPKYFKIVLENGPFDR